MPNENLVYDFVWQNAGTDSTTLLDSTTTFDIQQNANIFLSTILAEGYLAYVLSPTPNPNNVVYAWNADSAINPNLFSIIDLFSDQIEGIED